MKLPEYSPWWRRVAHAFAGRADQRWMANYASPNDGALAPRWQQAPPGAAAAP